MSNTLHPSKRDIWKLRLQAFAGLCIYFPQGIITGFIFKYILGYKIKDHRELRKFYRKLVQDNSPLLICSNHLTYIDSIIIIWAFGSTPWYFLNYNKLSWNMPAAQYARESLFFKIFCYVSKCLFIERGGSAHKIKTILSLSQYLLKNGRIMTVFPEGTRSRTGTFEVTKLKMGAGKLLSHLDSPRVLCLYMRSDRQTAHSKFPPRNSFFKISTEIIYPKNNLAGRDSHEDIVQKIGNTISSLEKKYFTEIKTSQKEAL